MHRYDKPCHWCGELKPVWQPSAHSLRTAAALALMVTAAGGVWRFGPALRSAATSYVLEDDFATNTSAVVQDNTSDRGAMANGEGRQGTLESGALPNSEPTGTAATVNAEGAPTGTGMANAALGAASDAIVERDSVVWTPVVARTWVNVRSDASRGGEVVGVIKPDSRALLGVDRAGWRRIRMSDVSGWVDPRLFEADSSRGRGQ